MRLVAGARLFLALVSFALADCGAHGDGRSSARDPDESPEDARDRVMGTHPAYPGGSAGAVASPVSALSLTTIPELSGPKRVRELFFRLRDERAWSWNSLPGFARRLPWLYPIDGCYVRAELMASRVENWGFTAPAQLFIFGDIADTQRTETYFWWYHVAPSYRVGPVIYVIDPSVEIMEPLTLEVWISRIALSRDGLTLSACSAHTVRPDMNCDDPSGEWPALAIENELQDYLGREWEFVKNVDGLVPESALGSAPPWLHPGLRASNSRRETSVRAPRR